MRPEEEEIMVEISNVCVRERCREEDIKWVFMLQRKVIQQKQPND